MLNYIALYPNAHEKDFNNEFLLGTNDKAISDYIISVMRDFEAIENIEILSYDIITDQDEVDINNHTININYKKKDLDSIEVPKYKYITESRYGEIIFKIKVSTNLNEKIITKRILMPMEHEGVYLNNNKKMKAIWQMVDASTYSQRGKLTLKARMPIIVYHNKHRITPDVHGTQFVLSSYSYALDTSSKKRPGAGKKKKAKFINPLMIYAAKMGINRTIEFFGMKDIVSIVSTYDDDDESYQYVFPFNDIFILVDRYLFDKYDLVKSFICMLVNLQNRDFPVMLNNLENKEYWICRIGYVGSVKNKNIFSFKEKGMTTIYMIERLLNETTTNNLRLPMIYKNNIYYLLYWMISNFELLKQEKNNNIDMKNKRIRKNEVIVLSTLGKKISENINKLIERKSKSKMNTLDTLLELFNFNSDIIVSGMRNLNDLIKSDDLVNDMTFLSDLSYTCKGPNSLGENSSKMIASKYRYLDPSMVGVLDLFTTSNSDCGMSGSFVPFVKTYDGFYFTPDKEPCQARYIFDKALKEEEKKDILIDVSSFDSYIQNLEEKAEFNEELKYEPIIIIEKEIEAPSTVPTKVIDTKIKK